LNRSSQPNLIRYLGVILPAAMLAMLLHATSASAADYSVDFGVDSEAGRDAGLLTCMFEQTCHAKMESLGLTLSVRVPGGGAALARVRLSGSDQGCCYFRGVVDTTFVDRHLPLSRVPFFRGSPPRGGLFFENKRAGILYLRFSPRRDPNRRQEKDAWNENGEDRTKAPAAAQFDRH
jgi:hypothetical protein